MFFIISKLLTFIINPTVWIITLFLMALVRIRTSPAKAITLLKVAFFLMIVLTNKLFFVLCSSWYIKTTSIIDDTQAHSVGIVLGGYNQYKPPYDRIQFNPEANRFTDAISLYNHKKISKILLTGGSGALFGSEKSESELARKQLIDWGIDSSDILIEDQSRNTYENALFSLKKYPEIAKKKVLLITSASHMPRSKQVFNRLGIEVTPFYVNGTSPIQWKSIEDNIIPDPFVLHQWKVLIREWVGLLVYKLKGYA